MLDEIEPKESRRLIDLVEEAGFDVNDWQNFKGGPAKASANPKYCYEWSFLVDSKILLNLWFDEMVNDSSGIFQQKNFRSLSRTEKGPRRLRAKRTDDAIRTAFSLGLGSRVIVLKRNPLRPQSIVKFRLLDDRSWFVESYNEANGACVIRRGPSGDMLHKDADSELESFHEGEQRRRFVLHRKRERAFRLLKLRASASSNGGRLICEVPGCGFDFFERYGTLGKEYAQVHHKVPLSMVPPEGAPVALDKLAVVCANCHVMIYLGGECRELETLIPGASTPMADIP